MTQEKAEENFPHASCSPVQSLILMNSFLDATEVEEIKSLKKKYMDTACIENAIGRYLSCCYEKQELLKKNMPPNVKEEFEVLVNRFL